MDKHGMPDSLVNHVSTIIDKNHQASYKLAKLRALEKSSESVQKSLESQLALKNMQIDCLQGTNDRLREELLSLQKAQEEKAKTQLSHHQSLTEEQWKLHCENQDLKIQVDSLKSVLSKVETRELATQKRLQEMEIENLQLIHSHKQQMENLISQFSYKPQSQNEGSAIIPPVQEPKDSQDPQPSNQQTYAFCIPCVDDSLQEALEKARTLEEKYNSSNERAHKLETYLNSLLEQIETKAPLMAEQKNDYENLLQSYNELSKKHNELSNITNVEHKTIQELNRSLVEERTQKTNLEQKCNAMADQIQKLVSGVSSDLVHEYAQLKVAVREIDKEIRTAVDEEIKISHGKIAEQESLIQKLNIEMDILKSRVEVSHGEDFGISNEYVYDLRLSLATLENEKTCLENKCTHLERSNLYLHKDIRAAQQELKDLLKAVQNKDLNITNLNNAILNANRENSMKDTQIRILRAELADKTPRHLPPSNANVYKLEIQDSPQIYEAWQKAESALIEAKERWGNDVARLQAKIENMSYHPSLELERLIALEAENRNLKETAQELQTEVLTEKQKKLKISRLLTNIKKHNAEFNQLLMAKAELEKCYEEIASLVEQNNRYKNNRELQRLLESLSEAKEAYLIEKGRADTLQNNLEELSQEAVALKCQNSDLKQEEQRLHNLVAVKESASQQRFFAELDLEKLNFNELQEKCMELTRKNNMISGHYERELSELGDKYRKLRKANKDLQNMASDPMKKLVSLIRSTLR